MKEPSKEQIKTRAKYLREVLRDKHQIELPHGHALEVLAKVFGFKNWNTASALVDQGSAATSTANQEDAKVNVEKPIAAKFETVGELREFLSKFDDSTKLSVNEYKWSELDPRNFDTVTSICSLTYDQEIQNGAGLHFELNTEKEVTDFNFGRSATQSFEKTPAGRSQRVVKLWAMMKSRIWNPKLAAESFRKG